MFFKVKSSRPRPGPLRVKLLEGDKRLRSPYTQWESLRFGVSKKDIDRLCLSRCYTPGGGYPESKRGWGGVVDSTRHMGPDPPLRSVKPKSTRIDTGRIENVVYLVHHLIPLLNTHKVDGPFSEGGPFPAY